MRLPLDISQIKKIAILRANVLGDFIFALPALQSLKHSFPNAEIIYLGRQWHVEFLKDRKGPWDRVISIPKYNGVPHEADVIEDAQEVELFFQEMQKENFDIALQFHGGGKNSNPFINKLGAKFTAGFKTPNADPLNLNIPYSVYHHEVLRYLEVVVAIGGKISTLSPSINVTKKDADELAKVIDIQKPYIVIHPGGSSIRRRWKPENFSQVAEILASYGFQIMVTGSQEEFDLAKGVLGNLTDGHVNLCGKLSLHALTALLSKAALVISNDTGPLHLARAVKVPTVGIFLGVNMIMASPVEASINRVCIAWRGNCPFCGKSYREDDFNNPTSDCSHNTSLLDEIPVDEVVEYALELINVHATEYQATIG